MAIAHLVSQRSYDPTLKVGAIIVSQDNSQMLSIGYNGNYRGGANARESQSPGQSGFIHAEVNALVKCDFNFHKKKHMYLTHSPCRHCAKLIVNADISTVIYDIPYRDISGLEILTSVGINVFNLSDAIINNKTL
jgi:dCMP deaminase